MFALGLRLARGNAPLWGSAYATALVVILLITIGRRAPQLELVPPFSWVLYERWEFAFFTAACALLFGAMVPRLTHARPRRLCWGLLGALLSYGFVPFLLPVLDRSYLQTLETTIDSTGVCLQSNSYTCGPAAAVTALGQLGLEGEEGELSVLAYTNSWSGTQPDLLCMALEKRYRDDGLRCEQRFFERVSELRAVEGTVLVVIEYSFLVDHYVAVLEVTGDHIIAGDPLKGRVTYTYHEFTEKWRKRGVILSLADAESIATDRASDEEGI
jgi:hypothetical protein